VVGQRVPVVDHTALARNEKARAVDHIGPVGDERGQDLGILGRVVFQIGILDDAEFAGGLLQPGADGGAFAGIDLVMKDADAAAVGSRQLFQYPCRAIGGTIVHDHNLRLDSLGKRGIQGAQDGSLDVLLLVINRHDNRQQPFLAHRSLSHTPPLDRSVNHPTRTQRDPARRPGSLWRCGNGKMLNSI
jgi:hypothetical protein